MIITPWWQRLSGKECFKSRFQCPNMSKSHTLIIWNVTVTLWTFTLWMTYSVDIHIFTLQLNLQTSGYCFQWLNRKCFQYKSSLSLIKGASTFISQLLANGYTMDVNLYKVELMQHSKESMCLKFDSQCQINIWKKLHVQYVGCSIMFIE